jgi:hypothetical protein
MAFKYRNLIAVFLLSIFTLGIYFIYWSKTTKDELNEMGGQIPTTFLVIIPGAHIYFWYKYSQAFVKYALKSKTESDVLAYCIMTSFVTPAGILIIQSHYNNLASKK